MSGSRRAAVFQYVMVALILAQGASAAVPPPPPPPVKYCMNGPYLFFFDQKSSDLAKYNEGTIDNVLRASRDCPNTSVTVEGHTDLSKGEKGNDDLALKRAANVATQLIEQGIPATDIEISSKGSRDIAVPTNDGVAEIQNRRVVLYFVPKTTGQ